MRIRSVLVATTFALVSLTLTQPAEAAGASCTGYRGGSKTINFNAFAGHKVRATYRWCSIQRSWDIAPIWSPDLRGVSTPVISFPSRVPTGLGEKLSLSQRPYLYSWSKRKAVFRFSVHQGHVAVPLSSDYDFELRVYAGGQGRICFVGRACSSLQ